MNDEDVGDVGGLPVVVGEVDVDVETAVVLGIVGVYAGDVVIFYNYGVVRRYCGLEKERVLEVFSGRRVFEVDRVGREVVAVMCGRE